MWGLERVRRPRHLFVQDPLIWRKVVVGRDSAGALVFDYPAGVGGYKAFVEPVSEAQVLEFRELGQSVNYAVLFWRDDAGTLPVVRPDDHITFTDRRGLAHLAAAQYGVDEALAGVVLRVPCLELTEGA
jgi:hypothetical protein